MSGQDQFAQAAAQLTEAAAQLTGLLKSLQAEVTSLESRKVALAAEVASVVARSEPLRKEAEGQGRATKEAYERCRQARVELESVNADLAASRKATEKELSALRKKVDAAYADRVAEREAELHAIETKIAAAKQAFDEYRRHYLAA